MSKETHVTLTWPDGHTSCFHNTFLRSSCSCPLCKHSSGQRLISVADLPLENTIREWKGTTIFDFAQFEKFTTKL